MNIRIVHNNLFHNLTISLPEKISAIIVTLQKERTPFTLRNKIQQTLKHNHTDKHTDHQLLTIILSWFNALGDDLSHRRRLCRSRKRGFWSQTVRLISNSLAQDSYSQITERGLPVKFWCLTCGAISIYV